MDAVSDDELAAGAKFWWVMLVVGLFSVALGVIMITRPFESIAALAWLAGLFLLIGGISGFFGAKRREVGIGWAIVSVISGLVLLFWPGVTVAVVGLVLGIGALIAGIGEIITSFELKKLAA